jgi:hypothetical protein
MIDSAIGYVFALAALAFGVAGWLISVTGNATAPVWLWSALSSS